VVGAVEVAQLQRLGLLKVCLGRERRSEGFHGFSGMRCTTRGEFSVVADGSFMKRVSANFSNELFINCMLSINLRFIKLKSHVLFKALHT